MATWFTVVGSNMPLRFWSSRTRFTVSYLSPTATRGGGPTTSTDLWVFCHNLNLKRKPNLSSWISRTFQIWPMLTSIHRTPTYRWAGRSDLEGCLFLISSNKLLSHHNLFIIIIITFITNVSDQPLSPHHIFQSDSEWVVQGTVRGTYWCQTMSTWWLSA